ncbi:MAG: hypothetical protein ACRDQ4_08110 [Pseudonocardiaceae bacterium]
MSATLIAKELSAGHGDQLLFSGLDLVVAPGDVIGLVGANGAGNTTLRSRHTYWVIRVHVGRAAARSIVGSIRRWRARHAFMDHPAPRRDHV